MPLFRSRFALAIGLIFTIAPVPSAFCQSITPLTGQSGKIQKSKQTASVQTSPAASQVAKKPAMDSKNPSLGATTDFLETVDFGLQVQGEIGYMRVLQITLPSKPDKSITLTLKLSDLDQAFTTDVPFKASPTGGLPDNFITIVNADDAKTDLTKDFKYASNCNYENPHLKTSCIIVIGFISSQAGLEQAQLNLGDASDQKSILLKGTGGSGPALAAPTFSSIWFPFNRHTFSLHPGVADKDAVKKLEAAVLRYFDTGTKSVENFYHATSGSPVSILANTSAVYNPSAGSTSVGADIATLDFVPGIELGVAANVQTGTGSSAKSASPSSIIGRPSVLPIPLDTASAALPTLSYAQAAQAAQNLANGGNLIVHAMYPFLAYNSNQSMSLNGVFRARDGVDIPNFAGTNAVITDPVNHFSAFAEGNLRFNAIQPTNGKGGGSIFIDGSYGYDYTAHSFSRQSGWGNRAQYMLGQLAGGIILTDSIGIGFQRNFGPSQNYIDSTSKLPMKVNQFQTWSLGITYAKKSSN